MPVRSNRRLMAAPLLRYAAALVLFLFAAKTLAPTTCASDNGLGLTPPMGWNSWNHFACNGLNETIIHETAAAIVSLGLDQLGYRYINLDDCWHDSTRNASGYLQADEHKFPSGMAALSAHLHSMNLRFGLYSDAGLFTCAGRPGSLGYETHDARQFVHEWQIDYLKYDNCFDVALPVQWRYQRMYKALNATGRAVFWSLCDWGVDDPATWAPAIGNAWRTTYDIRPTWQKITQILDQNDKWHAQAGPGGWNDPDILEVGEGQLSIAEQRTHFTLWCLIKAPLLLGNDLRHVPANVLDIITNKELIAWNQDVLGQQGYKRWSSVGINAVDSEDDDDDQSFQVWAGDLSAGRVAVVLLNRSQQPQTITARWSDIGYPAKAASVRDVWKHQDLGVYRDQFAAMVNSHDVVAIELSPTDQALKKKST